MGQGTARSTDVKRCVKGQVILRERDETARVMILLLQGTVGIYKNYGTKNQVQVNVLSQGSFYGEMALFLGKEPEHTLVALSDGLLLEVSRKNVAEFITGQPDMAVKLMEGICGRLDQANSMLEKYSLKDAGKSRSQSSTLFPEGHGSYLLQLSNQNDDLLYTRKYTCPLCAHAFDHLTVLTTKLRLDHTDPDQRVHYRDIEPMHYEIVTCPNCYLSAAGESFEGVSRRNRDAVNKKVGPYTLEMYIQSGAQRDTFTVFAGFYLAILCAPILFDNHQLTTGGLWQKLGRLYQDCEDENMFLYTSKKALEEYLYAYEHFKIGEKQMQQLCYVIGDLYARLGDIDQARTFFYQAKINKAGSNVMIRQADMRLEQLKELKEKLAAEEAK